MATATALAVHWGQLWQWPFNCQIVVKRQQIKNRSNLGILRAMAHTLFLKCIQLAALGPMKSAERGAYVHTALCVMCVRVRVGCNVMPVCLACHCLVACIGYRSDSPCVSCDHPWLPVDFQRIPHYHWCQPPPVLQKLQNLEASMTKRTELAQGDGYACLDPPTDTTQSQHPHTSLYKFCGHCEDGAARSHISTWVGVVYCSFSAAHFKFRSESGNGATTPCGAVTGFTFVARIP